MSGPESIEDYYARIEAALDEQRRLPVAVEEMPGWDIYPYEIDSLRVKPLAPLADSEPARRGEDPSDCWCARLGEPGMDERLAWSNDRWRLSMDMGTTGLPVMVWLSPIEHCDLPTMPNQVASELGVLIGTIAAAVEELPSVGRAQLAKYGDGGAHLHVLVMGRPARILQFRGSPLLDWEENLPRMPREVLRRNARPVGEAMVAEHGGSLGPALA